MSRRILTRVVGLGLSLALGLAGCDDDEPKTQAPAPGGTTSEAEDESGTTTSGDPDEPTPAVIAYCDCVFARCHDNYHAKWGEDELVSRLACEDEATALPDQRLQCRQARCDEVTDAMQCPPALGEPACSQ